MSQRTSYQEREEFVRLHEQGFTYNQIAERSGWKATTVRKHCWRYQKQGVVALRPGQGGRAPRGLLSSFAPVVRFAALRIKRRHPGWGAPVVLDELEQCASVKGLKLPKRSQLAAYFAHFGARLIKPQRRLHLPPPLPSATATSTALVFQLDMQERLYLAGIGYFNVLQIRAPQWGITVGCYPHLAGGQRWQRKVSQSEARNDCRQTFTHWGLPDVLQTDHDKVLVGTGEYPFPSYFTLWLVGLGIEHRTIGRVIQNGSVERTHLVFDKQMLSGVTVADWPAFLAHVEYEQRRLNERIPSHAKACRGLPPLLAHPEARCPRRPYRPAQEATLFSMQRVYTYLAGGRWLRHASTKGQFKFADRTGSVGAKAGAQPLIITFDQDALAFSVASIHGQQLLRLSADWLTEAAIRGLSDTDVVNVLVSPSP